MTKKRSREAAGDAVELPAKKLQRGVGGDKYWESHFGDGLFDDFNVRNRAVAYNRSSPYKHGVIDGLVNDELLRGVREEVLSQIHYTQKETDIYKIHQSGDLANLDGLDDASLAKLPNLLRLRDALYSPKFRRCLEDITDSGKLSGQKTDMAINVYTPGSHLLCHDDVIGSRRISYILYLTDPDDPWQESWGGALRLYPTKSVKRGKGKVSHIPKPDPTEIIYPAWNQLSFFAVQPGLSFHDVGEVFENPENNRWGQPMRMAISGWFHIPQPGEEGFKEGEAEALQKQSSLTTLQSSDEQFDYPQPRPTLYPEYDLRTPDSNILTWPGKKTEQEKKWEAEIEKRKAIFEAHKRGEEDPEHDILTVEEAEFLCKYINPNFLAPDQAEEMQEAFHDDGQIVIEKFLHPKFAKAVQHYIDMHHPETIQGTTEEVERQRLWKVAKPPHKHKYLVIGTDPTYPANIIDANPDGAEPTHPDTLRQLLSKVFNSLAFRKWLQIITGLVFKSHDLRIRRFRRGQDYQLAKLYNAKEGRIELTLGLTTAGKWEAPEEDEEAEHEKEKKKTKNTKGSNNNTSEAGFKPRKDHRAIRPEPMAEADPSDETNHGGYEMFIRGDEDEDEDLPEDERQRKGRGKGHSHLDVTGKQQRKSADPAVYQAAGEGEDDGILLNMAAGFNRLSIVLRDQGTMRFVKYVSERAGADRWDLSGEWEVDWKRSATVHGWDDEEMGDQGENEEEKVDDEDEDEGEGGEDDDEMDGDDDEDGDEEDEDDGTNAPPAPH